MWGNEGEEHTRIRTTKPSRRHTSTTELIMDSQWIWRRASHVT